MTVPCGYARWADGTLSFRTECREPCELTLSLALTSADWPGGAGLCLSGDRRDQARVPMLGADNVA